MNEFSRQDWLLINDLINITWQAGAVKSPQMGQALEVLRSKVGAQIEPPPKPPEPPKDPPKG